MDQCCLHHIELGVKDGSKLTQKLTSQYSFKLIATRTSAVAKQWVLTTGQARFLLTEITSDVYEEIIADPFVNLWFDPNRLGTNGSERERNSKLNYDSAFDVAIQVQDIEKCVKKLIDSGVKCLRPIQCHKSDQGDVKTATIVSCVGDVKHTLVQSNGYRGLFMPGFAPVTSDGTVNTTSVNGSHNVNNVHLTHVDHVTFVCEMGTLRDVLSWYEKHFGMARFTINRDEDEKEGMVIQGDNIGLRMVAFEYWKCAEVGLITPSRNQDRITFVLAESLPCQGPSQVDTFLQQHNGPGVQHIALHTPDIISTIAGLRQKGVKFAEPPSCYYMEEGKLEEIQTIGLKPELLQSQGILIDMEADADKQESADTHRYLMQKFTLPLFDRDTLFLEIIQRCGASGFGFGNIKALWRSVSAYLSKSGSQNL
ncbi:4-hydroxyphenylpyruvate dioxygenase-like protein [Haliotis rufescens]|uniref:4-hydroxyphenylpyruvate dioxygenase-like protein n=1 Tax=Haliotis rufescens TaxID=6454 RepID=UPI001EB001B7|nr:4-hydroxyphenylpyruvate dioxygenase-like protein [Haliotis rufescens]